MRFDMWLPSIRSRFEHSTISARRGQIRGKSANFALFLEKLEERTVLSPYFVTTTADSGAGSLRHAIETINADSGVQYLGSRGVDEIDFNITAASDTGGGFSSVTGIATITPQTALPAISNPAFIDGYTQSGATANTLLGPSALGSMDSTLHPANYGDNAVLKIQLNGANAGIAAGLQLTGNNITVQGLVINRFAAIGIAVYGTGNTIQGNFLGTGPSGTQPLGNGGADVLGYFDASQLLIGGCAPGARNIISGALNDYAVNADGSGGVGVMLFGDQNVQMTVQGNFIGTDVAGRTSLENALIGISVYNNDDVLIGGSTSGAGNLISGNSDTGISINANGGTIQGNFIGTDVTGTAVIPNATFGIYLIHSNGIHIGGPAGNLISGNGDGIRGDGDNNVIQGNLIGTDVTGIKALINNGVCINFGDGGSDNQIGGIESGDRNVILGGIQFGTIFGPSSGNGIQGNYIGTDIAGTAALYTRNSISITFDGSTDNTIGGTDNGAGNVIAGQVFGWHGSDRNYIQGNFIGLNAAGTRALGTDSTGVRFYDSSNILIGGSEPKARNVIAAEFADIDIERASSNNVVEGNYLGTSADGMTVLDSNISNAYGVFSTFGAVSTTIVDNLIDGHLTGIFCTGDSIIKGNKIGTDGAGNMPLPNGGNEVGVSIDGSMTSIQNNTIEYNGVGVIIQPSFGAGLGTVTGTSAVDGNTIAYNQGGGNWANADVGGIDILPIYQGNVVPVYPIKVTNNSIHDNGGPGVWVQAEWAIDVGGLDNVYQSGVQVQKNSIYNNLGPGIALGALAVDANGYPIAEGDAVDDYNDYDHLIPLNMTGIIPNDFTTDHVGPNNWQNYPVLTEARVGANLLVSGTFESPTASAATPEGTSFTVDFYATPASGTGLGRQGEYFLGSAQVVTNASGQTSFTDVSLPLTNFQDPIETITATATNNKTEDTSEFSAPLVVVQAPSGDNSIAITQGTPNPVTQGPLSTTLPSALVTLNGVSRDQVPLDGKMVVLGDTGDDAISASVAPSGGLELVGEGGTNIYSIQLGNLSGPVTVSDSGLSGASTLTVNGVSGANSIVKTADEITWGSPVEEEIDYSGIAHVVINGGSGFNQIIDPGATDTTINGGPAGNDVVITSTSGNGVVVNGGGGTNTYVIYMGNLAGPVTINGTTGASTLTAIAPTGSNTLTLSSTQLTGAGETINLNLGTTATNVTIDGSAGANQLILQGPPPGPVMLENIVLAASLSGTVFTDFNDDGQIDFGEKGIAGVAIALSGTDDLGHAVNLSQTTDADGAYVFLDLRPGSYRITETQPAGYPQGIDTVGTAGGSLAATDQLLVQLAQGVDGLNYNFGEQPPTTGAFKKGQAAGIGFWNNKNGQALILALNGGGSSHQLGDWLAATMPNTFGVNAGGNDLAGMSNAFVAALFQKDFVMKGVKLDAQVLATALSVYATNSTLDSTAAAAHYGFTVSGTGLGTDTVNVGSNGDAFGVANNMTMTVLDLLVAADAQAVKGLLYNGNSTKRNEANSLFSALNEAGGIS